VIDAKLVRLSFSASLHLNLLPRSALSRILPSLDESLVHATAPNPSFDLFVGGQVTARLRNVRIEFRDFVQPFLRVEEVSAQHSSPDICQLNAKGPLIIADEIFPSHCITKYVEMSSEYSPLPVTRSMTPTKVDMHVVAHSVRYLQTSALTS
jgi:hypothetical protein